MTDELVSLREHLEGMITAQGKRFDDLRAADKTALDAAFASADKAVQAAFLAQATAVRTALDGQKAETVRSDAAMEKRLDALNELRKDVAMSADVKAVKDTASIEFRALNDKMADLKERIDKDIANRVGRAGGLKDYVGWIVAMMTIIGTVAALMARHL